MLKLFGFITEIFRKEKRKPGRTNDEELLRESLTNAYLLVVASTEQAIFVESTSVSTILKARTAYKEGLLTDELEEAFWAAYIDVTSSITPISIDSIRCVYGNLDERWKRPLSQRCATLYKFLSIITLVSLIAVQTYWYIGYTLIDDINSQNDQINNIQEQLEDVKKSESSLLFNNLSEKLQEHKDWKDASYTHLENWNTVWSSMDIITLQPWQYDDFKNLNSNIQKRIRFMSAKNTLEAITAYLLPLLYGMIGACFYILRQLPKEVAKLTFTLNSHTQYGLRLVQGTLAGMMISYLVNPDPISNGQGSDQATNLVSFELDPGLDTLGPLALAFFAGYSVEYIFRFFDKILSIETVEEKENSFPHRKYPLSKSQKSLNQKENP